MRRIAPSRPVGSIFAGAQGRQLFDLLKQDSLLSRTGQEIDRLADPSASDKEWQLRKRRLIKGPKEFQDLRRNRQGK